MSITTTPARAYSFTDHSTRAPTVPQPGDRLDREFDAIYQALTTLGDLTRAVQHTAQITYDDLAPSTIARLKDTLAPSIADATRQIALLADILNTRVEDTLSAQRAVQDQLEAVSDRVARTAVIEQHVSDQAAVLNELATQAENDTRDAENAANDAALSAAAAHNDEQLASAWAEYMPNEIPASYFAHTSITGQHWSSRWWANQAAGAFGALASLYLGAHPSAPTTTPTGKPIPVGAIYYNTTAQQPFVWNGTAWVPFYAPTKALTLTLSYQATADQTTFPFSTPDRNGQTYVVSTTSPEPLEVFVNGARVPRDAPTDGTGDWDFDPATNTLTFLKPLLLNTLILIDILAPPATAQTGVPVTVEGIHAALTALRLIAP